MDFHDALKYLLGLGHETLAIKLGLTTTERLLEALDSPQLSFPSVQIAGTNGKGSTAVMVEAIALAAGIKTGLYTSPHLISITERVRVNGAEVSREQFAAIAAKVRFWAEQLVKVGALAAVPTFFEQVTAIALVAFKEAGVDLAILETGLGGRLDATTTARANVVAITPIALDHQEYLGTTLAEIAVEKAAIIRPGVTAVIARQDPEVMKVILDRCAQTEVLPRQVSSVFGPVEADETGRVRATFITTHDQYDDVRLGLRGRHQVANASVAIALAEALQERGYPISRDNIRQGIESASHPGRLDLREGRPPMLFDGAHNVAGAEALRAYLDEFVTNPMTLVFGSMRDKDLAEIAAILFPAAERLILTQPSNPRAAFLEVLSQVVPVSFQSSRITLAPTVEEALKAARRITPEDGLVCVTGSLYLVGEVLGLLEERADARSLPMN